MTLKSGQKLQIQLTVNVLQCGERLLVYYAIAFDSSLCNLNIEEYGLAAIIRIIMTELVTIWRCQRHNLNLHNN